MKSLFTLLWIKRNQNKTDLDNTRGKGNNCSLGKQDMHMEKVGSFCKLSTQMALCVSLALSPSSCQARGAPSLLAAWCMDRPTDPHRSCQGTCWAPPAWSLTPAMGDAFRGYTAGNFAKPKLATPAQGCRRCGEIRRNSVKVTRTQWWENRKP